VIFMHKWVLLIAVVVTMAAVAGCLGEGDAGGEDEEKVVYQMKNNGAWGPVSGYTGENEVSSVDINFNDTYIAEITLVLTWTDTNNNGDPEPAQDDTFTMEITGPNGTEPVQKTGAGNKVEASVKFPQIADEPVTNNAGWNVKITCEPGQGSSGGPGLGLFIIYSDSGNDWTLNAEYSYLAPVVEGA
jgi:hypothetical protein